MSVRGYGRISVLILLVSAVAWVMLLVSPTSTMPHAHDLVIDSGAAPASSQIPTDNPASATPHVHHSVTDSGAAPASLPLLLAMKPLFSLLAGWALMLVAMMSPTLIAPICHIIARSFRRRHARSVTLFVIGYAAIWIAAGVVLIATMLMLKLLMPQSYWPTVGVGIVAFVWQCSPIKQRCLNRSHNHRELAEFGRAADLDALHFGITHGVWCLGSCWALMLLPLMVSYGHFAAMAVVTFVMTSERLEHPQPLGWRLHLRAKLMRIMVAQTQIQFQKALARKLY
jgi:predicted metal-binding membrane protein